MLTLFHAPQSRSTRILWLLEEIGAPYEVRHVGIRYMDGSGPGPDATNIHPDKKVPALLHDGALVTESTAIALYLCERFSGAGLAPAPGDADRGAFLSALCWADNEFGMNLYMRRGGMTDPRTLANLGMAQRRLIEALARGPYMVGERFSAVDVMIGFAVLFVREHLPADERIDAYAARLRARPAVARALAKDAFPAVAA
ncbi:MAG: glutathione S-transferase [Caulobacteraceae bacterium]|nr:glutathione S-transferase [Caulobacter sp.]